MQTESFDAVIIGGGPAGLTAAIYLARFRRNTLVLDAGDSRAAWVPVSHNHAGFPDGIRGTELLQRMRAQAATYGAQIAQASVENLEQVEGGFRIMTADREYSSRTLLLAMGIVDIKPELPNLSTAVRDGLVRYCPVCDAFEAIDRNIVIIGHGISGFGEADFLTDYSTRVTVLTNGEAFDKAGTCHDALIAKGVAVNEAPVADIRAGETEQTVTVYFTDGTVLSFETAYAAIGCRPRNALASALGVRLAKDNRIETGSHQETSIEGCFAAGDIVTGLNQISVAMGQAAIAAAAMHNRLRSLSKPLAPA